MGSRCFLGPKFVTKTFARIRNYAQACEVSARSGFVVRTRWEIANLAPLVRMLGESTQLPVPAVQRTDTELTMSA